MTRVLVVDNRDSFVHTLVGYLRELGAHVDVVEADEIADAAASVSGYDGVVISPGPGTPERAGASIAVVNATAAVGQPLLGVCLGLQAIAAAFGATVDVAPELKHGMTSLVHHGGDGLFEGLAEPFTAGRYHSLAVVARTMPVELEVTAATEGGVVMGLAHRTLPIAGVQFHPESVLTDGGHRLLGNWLVSIGSPDAAAVGAALSPLRPVAAGGAQPVQ